MSKSGMCGGGSAVYGAGFLGALVWHLQHSVGISEGLWGLFQAIFWPAFVVYELLGFLM